MQPNDRQVGGNHYKTESGTQHWDFTIVCLNDSYLRGGVTKYVARYKKKGTAVQDLEKALHYIEKIITTEYGTLRPFKDLGTLAVSDDPVFSAKQLECFSSFCSGLGDNQRSVMYLMMINTKGSVYSAREIITAMLAAEKIYSEKNDPENWLRGYVDQG